MTTISLCRAAVLTGMLLSATALADDLFPPPWRGTTGSTYQEWGFDNVGNPTAPASVSNPYGTPQMIAGAGMTYQFPGPPGITGDVIGWWRLAPGATMTFIVPNANDPTSNKEVYLQLMYTGSVEVSVTDPAGGLFTPNSTTTPTLLPSGAFYQSFDFIRQGCPPFETFTIHNPSTQNSTYIGQAVIDTICRVPTPGPAAALGLGLLTVSRRRR